MFDNTSGDLSNNLGLGDGALTQLTTGANNVAVGYNTLLDCSSGSSNVAIGNLAASNSNHSNTITINATGTSLDPTPGGNCFVAPIRNASAANALYYDNTTGEITWDASGGGGDGGVGNLVIGDLRVTGTAEAKALLLPQVPSAEGGVHSVVTNLDPPNQNPLMTKGMLWMNKKQGVVEGGVWEQHAFDMSRNLCAATVLEGKIYNVGGIDYFGANSSITNMSSRNSVATTSVYNPITNKWGGAGQLDNSRNNLAAATLDGKIYALGGERAGGYAGVPYERQKVQVYRRPPIPPSAWAWDPSMAFARRRAAAAVLEDHIYVVSGTIDTAGQVLTPTVLALSSNGGSWSLKQNIPTARSWLGAAALMGKLYAVGGSTSLTDYPAQIVGITDVYDRSTDTWESARPLLTPRAVHGVAAVGGKLYAAGGITITQFGDPLSTAEVYNPPPAWGGTSLNASGDWTSIAAMNVPRAKFGLAAWAGKLYAVGGRIHTYQQDYHSSVEVYDPATNTWTFIAPLAQGRSGVSVGAWGGKLYAAGGAQYDGGWNALDTIEVYDFMNGSAGWRTLDVSMNTARFGAASAVFHPARNPMFGKNTLYMIGGEAGSNASPPPPGGFLASVETYAPTVDASAALEGFGGFASMNTRRVSAFGTELGGKFYVGGGKGGLPLWSMAGPNTAVMDVEVYDPRTDVWSVAGNLPLGAGAGTFQCSATSLGGKLYVCGPVLSGWNGGGWGQPGILVCEPSNGLLGPWTEIPAIDNITQWPACAALLRKIYIVGLLFAGSNWNGTDVPKVVVYDPVTNSWSRAADMNLQRHMPGTVALLGKLYVVGGYDLSGGGTNLSPITSSVEAYDPPTAWGGTSTDPSGTWTEMAQMSSPKMVWNQVAAYQGKIVTVGGALTGGGGGFAAGALPTISHNCEYYNPPATGQPAIGSWSTSSLTLNYNGAPVLGNVAILEGNIYVAGGTTNAFSDATNSLSEAFHAVTQKSRTAWDLRWDDNVAELLSPRVSCAAVELGGRLYAIGGLNSYSNPTIYYQTTESYNPSSNTWTTLAATMTTPRVQHAAASFGGRIYVAGGNIASGALSPVATAEVYDPPAIRSGAEIGGTWSTIAPMNVVRHSFGLVVVGDALYAVGGMTQVAGNQDVAAGSCECGAERYDPNTDTWTLIENPTGNLGAWPALPIANAVGGALYAFGNGAGTGTVAYAALAPTLSYTIPESLETFSSLPTAPSTFYAPWSTATMGKVFVGGGRDAAVQTNNSMAAYDVSSGLWGPLNSQTNAGRQAACAEALGGKIYLFGGWYYGDTPADPDFGATAICCDYTTDTWTPIASMNGSHTYFGSAVLGGKIYAIGSWYNAADTTSRTVEAYDPSTNSWTNVAPMDASRGGMKCATLLGKIYAPGGGVGGVVAHASVEVYDPATGTWSYIAPLSAPRWAAQTLAVRGKLYVVGGGNDNIAQTIAAATEVYDPMNPIQGWTTLSDTLGLWYQGGATSMGNIYVIGGQTSAGTGAVVQDGLQVSVFSDESKWNLSVAPMNVARAHHGAAALGGKIYVAGGGSTDTSDNQPALASCEVYDPTTNVWSAIAPMNTARQNFVFEALGGKIYAVGGRDTNNNPLSSGEVYDPVTNLWRAIAPMQDTSGGPLMASWAAAGAALGGKLYYTGGSMTGHLYPQYGFIDNNQAYYDQLGGGGWCRYCRLYDPAMNRWHKIAPMTACDMRMSQNGGQNPSSGEDEARANSLWNGRRSHSLTAVGGQLFAVGGCSTNTLNEQNGGSTYQQANFMDIYTPGGGIGNAVIPRTGVSSPRFTGGWMPFIGGITNVPEVGSNNGLQGTGLSFFNEDAFTADDNSQRRATNHMAAAVDGKLYIMGGGNVQDAPGGNTNSNNNLGYSNIVKYVDVGGGPMLGGPVGYQFPAYNPTQTTTKYGGSWWVDAPPLDASNAGGVAVTLGGSIYVVGGKTGSQWAPTNNVEIYTPPATMLPKITYHGEDFYLGATRGGPKTFIIPHPEHEGKMLRHACLEAPTRGTNVYEYQIQTAEDNQTTTITLPSYFQHINGRPRVYVRPTNVLSRCCGYVNEDLTAALITTEKPGTFNVMVTGVRKDPDAVAYSATEHIDEPIAIEDIPSVQK